jgi:hypothetical protein
VCCAQIIALRYALLAWIDSVYRSYFSTVFRKEKAARAEKYRDCDNQHDQSASATAAFPQISGGSVGLRAQ